MKAEHERSAEVRRSHGRTSFGARPGGLPGPGAEEFVADAPEGADLLAFQTPDAIRAVRGLVNADADRALLLALPAERAGLLVHGHPVQADLVEQPEDGAQRAGRPAERPHDEDHPDEESGQDGRSSRRKGSPSWPRIAGFRRASGIPASSVPAGQTQLAEPGLSPAERVEDEERQENGQDDEEDILEISQELRERRTWAKGSCGRAPGRARRGRSSRTAVARRHCRRPRGNR